MIVWNNSTNNYDIYLNEEKITTYKSTDAGHATIMNFNNFIIGKGYYDNFNGKIDKMAIWSTIEEGYNLNQQLSGDEEGLEGCWNFNSSQGEIAKDCSINGNDGIIKNPEWSN